MARREKKGDDGGGYNYMDTYGDLVTLLLTFFVLLFAFSSVDDAKWNTLVEAFTGMPPKRVITAIELLDQPDFTEYVPLIVSQLSNNKEDMVEVKTPDGETVLIHVSDIPDRVVAMDPETAEIVGSAEYVEIERQFRKLYDDLLDYIETEGMQDFLYVDRDADSIYIRMKAGVLFESGSDKLLPDYQPMLDRLEVMLADTLTSIGSIRIEGHTDNVPISRSNPRFADNRDLSSARANSVVRYIEDKGNVPREMLEGVGLGEYHPIAPNTSEENRQQNRRVQFILAKRTLTLEEIQEELDVGEAGGQEPVEQTPDDPLTGIEDELFTDEDGANAENEPQSNEDGQGVEPV